MESEIYLEQREDEQESSVYDILSPRQQQVLSLIAEGDANSAIAAQLHIRIGTVKNHVHEILQRLGCSNRDEAASIFREIQGLPELVLQNDPLSVLSRRRREVLVYMYQGLTTNEIASTLNITPGTVKNHKHKVYETLGVGSQQEATVIYKFLSRLDAQK